MPAPPVDLSSLVPGQGALCARIHTRLGAIELELFEDIAPKTVGNFVGLALGAIAFTDPRTGTKVQRPYYDGLTFHRVIPDFMIQGGCPLGTGTGGPGYRFEDECDPRATHDEPGMLSMANAGPATNGSQFFITEIPTSYLNGRHTVFGRVRAGMDVLKKIARVERDARDRPQVPVVMDRVEVFRAEAQQQRAGEAVT
jgi:peptidyl-prolyl cis-trans isomerase A (cyclophilin A)